MSHTHAGPSHAHTLGGHTHSIAHTHAAGAHTHTGPSHTHGMAHTHTMGNHAHYINHSHTLTVGAHTHSVDIPAHDHTVDIPAHAHTVPVPSHTHGIVYGIYEGATATGVSILVDGTAVPAGSVNPNEMDIVSWLSKDAGGRIQRGAWHDVQIIPNTLTRIEANLFVQTFIQSVGGGDY